LVEQYDLRFQLGLGDGGLFRGNQRAVVMACEQEFEDAKDIPNNNGYDSANWRGLIV
jgi:hypothetical protein